MVEDVIMLSFPNARELILQVGGVSLCGALKNIVAVAAGFIDGLDYGNNSKGEFGPSMRAARD